MELASINTTSGTAIRSTTLSTPLFARKKRLISYEPPTTTVPVSCERFITPIISNLTFFSPIDPRSATNTYPPSVDCVFVLEGK